MTETLYSLPLTPCLRCPCTAPAEEEEMAGLDVSKHGASMHTFPEPIKPGSVHGHGANGVLPMVAESA